MHKLRAFTLIELLVVISVIALLLALLLLALNKARDLAQCAACQGNLKGYALAVQMYAQDNDDKGDKLTGRGNCAFVDGHVAAHTRAETFPLAWPR